MKNVFLSAALALAVAGSWAFYPKAPAEPAGYMMVVSRFVANGLNYKAFLTTIAPDGQVQTQEFEVKAGVSVSKSMAASNQFHVYELQKLNELRAAGWRVVTSTQTNDAAFENTFILEKQ